MTGQYSKCDSKWPNNINHCRGFSSLEISATEPQRYIKNKAFLHFCDPQIGSNVYMSSYHINISTTGVRSLSQYMYVLTFTLDGGRVTTGRDSCQHRDHCWRWPFSIGKHDTAGYFLTRRWDKVELCLWWQNQGNQNIFFFLTLTGPKPN